VEALGLALWGSGVKTGESWEYLCKKYKRAVWLTGEIPVASFLFLMSLSEDFGHCGRI
jgi:hypothetical protein